MTGRARAKRGKVSKQLSSCPHHFVHSIWTLIIWAHKRFCKIKAVLIEIIIIHFHQKNSNGNFYILITWTVFYFHFIYKIWTSFTPAVQSRYETSGLLFAGLFINLKIWYSKFIRLVYKSSRVNFKRSYHTNQN